MLPNLFASFCDLDRPLGFLCYGLPWHLARLFLKGTGFFCVEWMNPVWKNMKSLGVGTGNLINQMNQTWSCMVRMGPSAKDPKRTGGSVVRSAFSIFFCFKTFDMCVTNGCFTMGFMGRSQCRGIPGGRTEKEAPQRQLGILVQPSAKTVRSEAKCGKTICGYLWPPWIMRSRYLSNELHQWGWES